MVFPNSYSSSSSAPFLNSFSFPSLGSLTLKEGREGKKKKKKKMAAKEKKKKNTAFGRKK